jgi:hypothetical protein
VRYIERSGMARPLRQFHSSPVTNLETYAVLAAALEALSMTNEGLLDWPSPESVEAAATNHRAIWQLRRWVVLRTPSSIRARMRVFLLHWRLRRK